MALSATQIAARALIRLGARPITGFGDGTAEAEIAGTLYPSVRDGLLSAHAWSFATAQTQMPRLASDPLTDFPYAFALPPGFLRVMSAGSAGRSRGVSYRITGDAIHADTDSLVLTYLFRPADGETPAFFDTALIARLAAEMCIPVTENTSRTELMFRLAEEEFRRAKLIDSQQDTPAAIDDFSLVEVRD